MAHGVPPRRAHCIQHYVKRRADEIVSSCSARVFVPKYIGDDACLHSSPLHFTSGETTEAIDILILDGIANFAFLTRYLPERPNRAKA